MPPSEKRIHVYQEAQKAALTTWEQLGGGHWCTLWGESVVPVRGKGGPRCGSPELAFRKRKDLDESLQDGCPREACGGGNWGGRNVLRAFMRTEKRRGLSQASEDLYRRGGKRSLEDLLEKNCL